MHVPNAVIRRAGNDNVNRKCKQETFIIKDSFNAIYFIFVLSGQHIVVPIHAAAATIYTIQGHNHEHF